MIFYSVSEKKPTSFYKQFSMFVLQCPYVNSSFQALYLPGPGPLRLWRITIRVLLILIWCNKSVFLFFPRKHLPTNKTTPERPWVLVLHRNLHSCPQVIPHRCSVFCRVLGGIPCAPKPSPGLNLNEELHFNYKTRTYGRTENWSYHKNKK